MLLSASQRCLELNIPAQNLHDSLLRGGVRGHRAVVPDIEAAAGLRSLLLLSHLSNLPRLRIDLRRSLVIAIALPFDIIQLPPYPFALPVVVRILQLFFQILLAPRLAHI